MDLLKNKILKNGDKNDSRNGIPEITLRKLRVKVLKLKYGKIGFDIYSLNNAQRGIVSNYKSWQESSKALGK